jgi:4'-phosphopantetheinyl transferase
MEVPPLDRTRVHVWTASLKTATGAVSDLCRELAPDERVRADRFGTPELRRRFIVARVLLRRLLAAYASVDASALDIGHGAHGKPDLAGASGLCFNVSHAADAVIYAVAWGREVGIDIEATARDVDIAGVARQAFSSHECDALNALAPDARRAAFFRLWTRKEAYVKARGQGLSYPTRSFSVSHRADDDALIGDERDEEAPHRWRVIGLDAPAGFAAALGAAGRAWSVLRCDSARLLP